MSECAELAGNDGVVKMHDNPWVLPIADNLKLGVTHVFRYDTEDIGYYDYRPVTLLFACFISFQRYALS